MGSSYLGEDERGEYCETCYGRPSDVSREEYDKLALTLKAIRETHGTEALDEILGVFGKCELPDDEDCWTEPARRAQKQVAEMRAELARFKAKPDYVVRAPDGFDRFVKAALDLRGAAQDPAHFCAPQPEKVYEFDRAYLALEMRELTDDEAQKLYEEAKPHARPFTDAEVARFVKRTIEGPPSAPISTDEGERHCGNCGRAWTAAHGDDNGCCWDESPCARRAPAPEAERHVVKYTLRWAVNAGLEIVPILSDASEGESTTISWDTILKHAAVAGRVPLPASARLRDLLRTVEELHGKAGARLPLTSQAIGMVRDSERMLLASFYWNSSEKGPVTEAEAQAEAELYVALRNAAPALLALARGEVKS